MQHDNFDEKDSLQRIEQGDEVAARELLRHFHPFVLKLVRAHLPRRSSEEDLVQMIFIKVFHKLNQYTGRMPLEHWISRIAVNTCLNALKHLEEKSVEEIRALTGWSRSAIKVRAFRARARMKKMLNERETFAFA